jgi:hypothetical protein
MILGYKGSNSGWDCLNGDWLYKALCNERPVMVGLV